MIIFGWVSLILFACFGLSIIILNLLPFIITEFKLTKEKTNRNIKDKRFDLNERANAKKERDDLIRQKQKDLADIKLKIKLQKLDKQINNQEKKIKENSNLKSEPEPLISTESDLKQEEIELNKE